MIYRLTFRGKDPIQSIVRAGLDKLMDTFSGMPQQPCTDSLLRLESSWILKSETRAGNEGFIEHVYARFKDQSFVKAGDEWESSSGFRILVPYRFPSFREGIIHAARFVTPQKLKVELIGQRISDAWNSSEFWFVITLEISDQIVLNHDCRLLQFGFIVFWNNWGAPVFLALRKKRWVRLFWQ